MSSTVKEVVSVKALSRYGFQIGDDTYVNWSKGTKQTDKDKIVPGSAWEMELFISDKGAKYLNNVGAQVGSHSAPPVVSFPTGSLSKPTVTTVNNGGRDFDKEARGKTFCAYLSAILSNPSTNVKDIAELFPIVDACVARTFDGGGK